MLPVMCDVLRFDWAERSRRPRCSTGTIRAREGGSTQCSNWQWARASSALAGGSGAAGGSAGGALVESSRSGAQAERRVTPLSDVYSYKADGVTRKLRAILNLGGWVEAKRVWDLPLRGASSLRATADAG